MPARHALRDDLPALHGALLAAFAEDPLHNWLYPTDGPAAHGWFDVALRGGLRRGHTYCLAEDPAAGAAIWSPPDVGNLTRAEVHEIVEAMRSQFGEEGVARFISMGTTVSAQHPTEPHFYLFVIGVAPTHRGRQIGGELVAPALAICDAQGWPAYLESSNPRNVSFYERLGFQVTAEIPLDTGVGLQAMWRTPRS